MIQLRWSLNEKYEKTPRRKPEQHIPSEQTQTMEEEIVTRSEFLKLQDNDETNNKRESTYSKICIIFFFKTIRIFFNYVFIDKFVLIN